MKSTALAVAAQLWRPRSPLPGNRNVHGAEILMYDDACYQQSLK